MAGRPSISVPERFWEKVQVGSADECWPWTGYVGDTGYGQFHDGNRLVKAHRFAHGSAKRGEDVDHTCHNNSGCTDVPCAHRRCCNPAHLEAVTHQINSQRGRCGDHQSSKSHCPHGHAYSPDNTIWRRGGRHRICRTCNRARQRNYNQKRKVTSRG